MEKTLLKRLGYSVTGMSDPLKAIEEFLAHPDDFDLIITDQTMPGLTGDALAHEIQRIRSDIPIILCTGFSRKITEEQAKHMGIKGFLMKPIVRSQMARVIREVLDE